MNALNRLTNIFLASDEISFDDSSKFIIMSDCHRGDGGWSDTFSKNQNIFFAALTYYYAENFTYIELGDGDELWEIPKLTEIIREHSDVFWLMSKFYKDNRLHFIYGNHDMVKKDNNYVVNNLYKYYSERYKKYISLFENIKIHEGLILRHKETNNQIFLIHGHQVDFLNNYIWRIARFLVRYLWRPLETFGINDITRTAKNYKKKKLLQKNLQIG